MATGKWRQRAQLDGGSNDRPERHRHQGHTTPLASGPEFRRQPFRITDDRPLSRGDTAHSPCHAVRARRATCPTAGVPAQNITPTVTPTLTSSAARTRDGLPARKEPRKPSDSFGRPPPSVCSCTVGAPPVRPPTDSSPPVPPAPASRRRT